MMIWSASAYNSLINSSLSYVIMISASPGYPIWHSPYLKKGDSCFNHYCIVWYHVVLQCLTQCPQARLYCFRMPYGAVLFMLMLTAFAVLCLKYLCLRWYPCYVWYGSLDIPILGLLDFLPADSCTHSRNKSDCLDTLLALWLDHFYTRQTYI